MKKSLIIIVSIVLVAISIVSGAIPYIFEFAYNNTNEDKDLYLLCRISVVYNKDDFIIKYIPKFFNSDKSFGDDIQKDKFLSRYLNSVVKLDDFVEQQNALKDTLVLFSSVETAIPSCTNFIFDFYDRTGDLEKSKNFFEVLLAECGNLHFEYQNGVYIKYMQFLLECEDYKTFEKIKKERIDFLESNGMVTDNP